MNIDRARQELAADLARVGRGDHGAFRRVYEQTSRKLFGVCLRVLTDRGAAEDALQDVYISVWQHAARFDAARSSPITWLCTIARNHAIDVVRSSRRRAERNDRIEPIVTTETPVPIDTALAVAQTELHAIACLDQLGEQQRAAIREAFLEGMTYQQLADRRAVPLGTVKSWIRRGLLEMRKCLADA